MDEASANGAGSNFSGFDEAVLALRASTQNFPLPVTVRWAEKGVDFVGTVHEFWLFHMTAQDSVGHLHYGLHLQRLDLSDPMNRGEVFDRPAGQLAERTGFCDEVE